MFKPLKMLAAVFCALLITACNSVAVPETAINMLQLKAAHENFQSELLQTDSVLDQYKDEFSEKEWDAIERVRLDTAQLNLAIHQILNLQHSENNVVMDISHLLASIEQLNKNYRHAYFVVRPKVPSLTSDLADRLRRFHASLTELSSCYIALKRGGGETTELVIQTLQIVATGSRLFGA